MNASIFRNLKGKKTRHKTIIKQSFYGFLRAQIVAYLQLPVNDVRGQFYIAPSPTDQFYVLFTQSKPVKTEHTHTNTANTSELHCMDNLQCVQLVMNIPNKMINKNKAVDSDTKTERGRVNCFYCTVHYFVSLSKKSWSSMNRTYITDELLLFDLMLAFFAHFRFMLSFWPRIALQVTITSVVSSMVSVVNDEIQ